MAPDRTTRAATRGSSRRKFQKNPLPVDPFGRVVRSTMQCLTSVHVDGLRQPRTLRSRPRGPPRTIGAPAENLSDATNGSCALGAVPMARPFFLTCDGM